MNFKRYLIEIGQGVDMHGGDSNNAVLKALKDATHHCCMAGIKDILGLEIGTGDIKVRADIYVPDPDSVDQSVISDYLSMYELEICMHKGGADPEGLYMPQMGEGNHITIAIAVLTVFVNLPE